MHKAIFRRNRPSQYDLQSDFSNIKEALAEATYDVKGRLGEIISRSILDVKEKSVDAKDNVADYVAEKPFKSIGVAILTGFIIGYLFRR